MRFQFLAGALALAGPSMAFSDSSPLILFSSDSFPDAASTKQIQTAYQALENVKDILSSCPTDRYLLVSQPGVNGAELRGPNGCAMPRLCRAFEDTRVQGKFIISEVVGETTTKAFADDILTACAAQGKDVIVKEVPLPPMKSDRAGLLADNDESLASDLDAFTTSASYTILFVGTPDEPIYEPEFHTELKRSISNMPMRRDENETEVDRRPLFEKYQFFTPGVFMAIITAIILLSILGVGMRALSSLEVSYGAFDKDMGPAAQKKQQ